MIRHKKIYCDFFGIAHGEMSPCEACIVINRRNPRPIVDVHHLSPRGMGGDQSGEKDVIENLVGVCRECHDELEADVEKNALMTSWAEQVDYRKWLIKKIMFQWR